MSSLNKDCKPTILDVLHTNEVLHRNSVYKAHCDQYSYIYQFLQKSTSEITHKLRCEQKKLHG